MSCSRRQPPGIAGRDGGILAFRNRQERLLQRRRPGDEVAERDVVPACPVQQRLKGRCSVSVRSTTVPGCDASTTPPGNAGSDAVPPGSQAKEIRAG
ncbi:MAG TPA: hypothetical protein VFC16_01630 [Nakamurella sp.]|nr:hypothetical protein [Nakamurella sp.]